MMRKILLIIFCCAAVNAHAIVMAPEEPASQTAKQPAKKSSAAPSPKKPSAKTNQPPVAKQAALPPPSKASLGFYQAAIHRNYDMMEAYLQQGADINCLNCGGDSQTTALLRVLPDNGNWDFQMADWLIQRGADINIPNRLGQTPVMHAAASQVYFFNPSALENLIQRGANVKATDSMGRSALHYVREWSSIERPEYIALVDQLIAHGVDVNLQDKSGRTALMNAVGQCSPQAVKLMISYGANPALQDKLGKSALDIAMERATQSGQGSPCNEVVKVLSNPTQQESRTPAIQPGVSQKSTPQDSANFAGAYAGTYTGSDSGSFQVVISQDGTATLKGRSSKMGVRFTGEGKVNHDGTVAVGSASTGSTFTGSISPSGGGCPEFCVNGISSRLRHPVFKLDSKPV